MAVYCNECGSGNPDGSDFCSRCGAAIAQVSTLAGDLVLPEWLSRAAAESPDPAPIPVRTRPVEAEEQAIAAAPASIPTGDLASAIPNWLKAPLRRAATAQPEESLLIDPTDTRGFISEDDLPAWIRQIAIADAARRAETERKAAAAASAEPEPKAVAPAPVKRRLLPGEIEAVQANINPWLARGDRAAIEPQVVPDELNRPEPLVRPQPAAFAASGTPPAARTKANPSLGGLNTRYLLIGAIVLLVAVLILARAL